MKKSKTPHNVLAIALVTACSASPAENTSVQQVLDRYRPVPEAASACDLPSGAVARDLQRTPSNNIVIRPEHDNASEAMSAKKDCLRRWAREHEIVFLEPETGNVE